MINCSASLAKAERFTGYKRIEPEAIIFVEARDDRECYESLLNRCEIFKGKWIEIRSGYDKLTTRAKYTSSKDYISKMDRAESNDEGWQYVIHSVEEFYESKSRQKNMSGVAFGIIDRDFGHDDLRAEQIKHIAMTSYHDLEMTVFRYYFYKFRENYYDGLSNKKKEEFRGIFATILDFSIRYATLAESSRDIAKNDGSRKQLSNFVTGSFKTESMNNVSRIPNMDKYFSDEIWERTKGILSNDIRDKLKERYNEIIEEIEKDQSIFDISKGLTISLLEHGDDTPLREKICQKVFEFANGHVFFRTLYFSLRDIYDERFEIKENSLIEMFKKSIREDPVANPRMIGVNPVSKICKLMKQCLAN